MLSEHKLVAQWRQLPSDRQQEVIDFMDFLIQRSPRTQVASTSPSIPRQNFQQLRENIIAAGIPLLSETEIDQELADRRGGYQEERRIHHK